MEKVMETTKILKAQKSMNLVILDWTRNDHTVVKVKMCFLSFTEQSRNDYVLFQAASTIKGAIIREWTILEKADIESLRSFLLTFVTHKHG